MSLFRIEDYAAGIVAILLMVAISQVALYLARHAHVGEEHHKED